MKKEIKYNNLGELLNDLEQPIDYLSYLWRGIMKMEKPDLKQELYLLVIKTWKTYKRGVKDKGSDWWFMRMKWHLLNILKKSNRKPLINSISLTRFISHDEKLNE